MLAQRLPEQDIQPRIIDGPGKLKNTSNFRCYLMFDRSDVYVAQFGWSAVSPSRPARSQSASRSGRQGKRAAARGPPQPPLCGEHGEHGEHWPLMATATGVTLDQAGCVRPSASASHNPYSHRE